MADFENLTMKELMILAKIRNVNGYENMSKHLENIFTTTCLLKPTIKPALIPKKTYTYDRLNTSFKV